MLKTILMGSCVFVQGIFVKTLADGQIAVKVGNKTYHGLPVQPAKAV